MKTSDINDLKTQERQYEVYDSEFSGIGSFGVRVNLSGKKSFFYIYKIAKKRKRITLGKFPQTSLLEARKLAEIAAKEILQGKDPASESKQWKKPEIFREVRDFFLLELKAKGRKDKTIIEYQRIFKTYLSYLNDRNIKTIEDKELNFLLQKHSGSPVMQQRIQALLSAFFNFSVKERLVLDSPINSIKTKTNISTKPFVALNLESIRSIWKNSGKLNPLNKAIFRLLILTGQRPKDVLSLCWKNIQLKDWIIKESKRTLPITPLMNEALEELKNSGHSSHDYLFHSSTACHIKHIQRPCDKLNTLCNTNTSFSPSSFRKSFRTLLLKEKFSSHVVDEILGYKTFIKAEPKEIYSTLIGWSHLVTEFKILKPEDASYKKGKVIELYQTT